MPNNPGYADVETFLAEWLKTTLTIKTWADPKLNEEWRYEAPLTHVQRAPGEGDNALTLDSALLDLDTYAARADHARMVAEQIRYAIRVVLPLHTAPSGLFIKATQTVMAPVWLPDPRVYRRSATYRLILHSPL